MGLSALGARSYGEATEPFLRAMPQVRARFLPDTLRERLVLQHLNAVLRETTGLDPRPYQVSLSDAAGAIPRDHPGTQTLVYEGDSLTATQEQQVRLYIDLIRSQEA